MELPDLRDQYLRQFTELPKPGTPAAELTDRDKLALALAADVPCEFVMKGTMLSLRSKVPFGVADRGDGGYVIGSVLPRGSVKLCDLRLAKE